MHNIFIRKLGEHHALVITIIHHLHAQTIRARELLHAVAKTTS